MTRLPAMPSILSLMSESRMPNLSGITSFLGAQNRRQKLAQIYQDLLEADDHMLRDIGVTRLDVMRMRADLFK